MLWLTFSSGGHAEFQYFYFLFLPVVWAAARQGLAGAAVAAFLLQAGIVVAVEAQQLVAVTALELQMLGAVLALAGFFIGVVVDEQRRAAERLQQSLHLAAAGQMAAALAHELNQPLTALAAYGSACELLLDKGDSGERLADTIRRMVAESGRAADVVRRLRDFFRTGATKLEPVEVDALVAATAAPFRDRARDMQVQLVVSPASGATLLADRLQIEVALRNLIGNAFDAVARCTGERRVSVSATTDRRGRVSLVVEDTGPGISASAQTRLFEPFASTKSSGLGLGLVISRAVIEAHGGRLWAEAADHGIFKISLPLRETTHAAA
jgi:C4-dicarboxylate-specific signal transduction histidine kinase